MNIAEILKNVPGGTKLYSPIFGEISFKEVDINAADYPITINTSKGKTAIFTKEGRYYNCYENSECVLFPSKEQRDWSKFNHYKPGTFLTVKSDGRAFILKGYGTNGYPMAFGGINTLDDITVLPNSTNHWTTDEYRLATPSEITVLMGKLIEAGYEWDEEALELKHKVVKKELDVKQKTDELKEAAMPLIKYLCENYHPYVTVIVTPTSVEVLEGVAPSTTLKTLYYIKQE